jgi:hypothetical protein
VFWMDGADAISDCGQDSLFIPMLGDVSHNIFDRIKSIGFAKVPRGGVTLIENCGEASSPFFGPPQATRRESCRSL